MLSFALTMAMAAPCGIPHKHKHHAPEPVQTCATPAVPMCFRDPVPDPTEVILPPLQTYPLDTLTTEELPNYGADTLLLVSTGSYVLGGMPSGGALGFIPPNPPRPSPPARAPEISGTGAAGALTLLLGCVAIAKGKKRS